MSLRFVLVALPLVFLVPRPRTSWRNNTASGASLLGYAIWNSLLARDPAGAVVPYILLVPVVGIAAAWLAQDETPDAVELAGGVVMPVCVATATIRSRRAVASPA